MSVNATQRSGATNNQSAADYSVSILFLWNNVFEPGIYKNVSNATPTLSRGMLVARSLTVVGGLIPVTSANLADVIGVAANEGDITLASAATASINFCTKGTVDANKLVMPATVTLDTVVGNKVLRDILEGLGLHLDASTVENTFFDN